MEEITIDQEEPAVEQPVIVEVEVAQSSIELNKEQDPLKEQPANEEASITSEPTPTLRRTTRKIKRKNLHLSQTKNKYKRKKMMDSCHCKPKETSEKTDVINDFEEYVEEETAEDSNKVVGSPTFGEESNVIELGGGKKIYIIKPADINKKISENVEECLVHTPPKTDNQTVISKEDEYTQKISDALYTWFEKVVENGIQLTSKEILDKLKEIHKGAGEKMFWHYFEPNEDWLDKWKTKYDARRPIVSLKIRRLNQPLADKFVPYIESRIKDEGYHIKQVFCAQKIFIDFKTLPRKNKFERYQYRPPGVQRDSDRLTIMVCTNVDGSLKLPLLVIGRASSKDILKNIPHHLLPVSYVYHRSNWLNERIFKLWLKNEFAPRASKFLKSNYLPAKAFIIMEDYKPKNKVSINGMFENIEFERMDPFIVPILHPLERGVLQHIKTQFKLGFLKTILYAQHSKTDLDHFLKSISMRQVIFRLKDTWDSVTAPTIARCWSKLLPTFFDDYVNDTPSNKIIPLKEIKSYVQKIKGFEAVEDKSVQEWIDSFEDAPLFIPATINLVEQVNNDNLQKDQNVEEEKEFFIPDIVDAANTLLKFYEENSFLSGPELAVIRKAKQVVIDLAITRDVSGIKQKGNKK